MWLYKTQLAGSAAAKALDCARIGVSEEIDRGQPLVATLKDKHHPCSAGKGCCTVPEIEGRFSGSWKLELCRQGSPQKSTLVPEGNLASKSRLLHFCTKLELPRRSQLKLAKQALTSGRYALPCMRTTRR
jgi:hypothetical protein